MKKNKMMRLASALLVLVLLTTCAISGTFAKYVTTGDAATDSARVAKWGVTITSTDEMFYDSYKNLADGNSKATYTADEEDDGITVQANVEGTKIVAPGTNGALVALDVAGTPEVDTQVTYAATLTLQNWEVESDEYCPIIITVNTEDYYVGKTDIEDIDDLKAAVEAAIVAKGARYHTNDDLSAVEDDLQVSWRWEFEKDTVSSQTDVKDTALGDAATPATIALAVTATITQID